jgi:hypothetical protein
MIEPVSRYIPSALRKKVTMSRMSSKKYPNVDDNKLNDGSKKAIYVALFGNLGIAPVKAYCSSLYRKRLDVGQDHAFIFRYI